MSNENNTLASLQEKEKQLEERLKVLQTQASTLVQNSPERESTNIEIHKVESDLKEVQSKLEEKIEHSKEAKIETAIESVELAAKAADHYYLHLGVVEPVSGGLAAQAATQAVEMIKNHEATEAYVKGVVKEKIEAAKELIDEKFPKKDAAKEWEKDIAQKEQAINEKFDKEIKETEKSLQKQLDYVEKKYDDKVEKENKQNELKNTIEKVKTDIEKDRNAELKQQEERKDNLEKIKEATKGMEENERQRIIEQQRELERKLELERQRQIEEQNRRR